MTNLKLNALANQSLSSKEMNAFRGGNSCGCGCNYEGQPGGSSTCNNASANWDNNLTSPGTGRISCETKAEYMFWYDCL